MSEPVELFQKLTPRFRKELNAFFDIVVDQAHEVSQFRILFYSSQETIDLLNAAAKGFFADLFRMYVERIILGMCKVVEPQQFSIQRMHELAEKEPVREGDSPYDVGRGLGLIASMTAIAADIAPWRHKLISHADRQVALDRKKVWDFVPARADAFYFEHMQAFMEHVGRDVCPIDAVAYDDATDLVKALERAEMFRSLRDTHPDAWRDAVLSRRTARRPDR